MTTGRRKKELFKPNPKEKIKYSPEEVELGNFPSERKIETFIYKNIDDFMETIFGEKVKSSTRQKYKPDGFFKISKNQFIVKRGPRVDIYVECVSGNNYIIEIKKPNRERDVSIRALGQILMYGALFPEANRLVIVSTKYDKWFAETVSKYSLPIDFVLFAKSQMFLLKK